MKRLNELLTAMLAKEISIRKIFFSEDENIDILMFRGDDIGGRPSTDVLYEKYLGNSYIAVSYSYSVGYYVGWVELHLANKDKETFEIISCEFEGPEGKIKAEIDSVVRIKFGCIREITTIR